MLPIANTYLCYWLQSLFGGLAPSYVSPVHTKNVDEYIAVRVSHSIPHTEPPMKTKLFSFDA